MQAVCPNPGCGAPYSLSPQHVGRQFMCKKCGATVAVEPQGLRLASPAPGASYAASANASPAHSGAADGTEVPAYTESAPPRTSPPRSTLGHPLLDKLAGEVFTLAFGVGSMIVIFFLFMPLLDNEKIARRSAAIRSGDMTQQRLDREAMQKEREGTHRTTAELDEAKKRRDAWDKEKIGLQDDEDQAKIDADTNRYWYTWGMMFGFLILAVAALGYLTPQQTISRKVTGSVILCAILVFLFFRILAK